jgi:hypothetical protein
MKMKIDEFQDFATFINTAELIADEQLEKHEVRNCNDLSAPDIE